MRIGLIGFGAIGKHHARILSSSDAVTFVGVAETDSDNARNATEAGHAVYPSAEALFGQRLDGVVIAVPTQYHEELALEALERSCGVLVEKPIAMTSDAGRRIVDYANSRSLPLMVGYVERYNAAVRAAKKILDEGTLGDIVAISARRLGTMPPRVRDANVLIDIGVHDIDIAAFLSGNTLRLVAAQGGRAILTDRLDYASLSLAAGNIAVDISTNWITPVKIRTLSITGTRAFLDIDYVTQDVRLYPGRTFESTANFDSVVQQYADGHVHVIPVEKREPLAVELGTFVGGLRGEPLPDPAIALESLRIAESATLQIEESESNLLFTGVA